MRRIDADSLALVQKCNIVCLPENYNQKYYDYHYLTWPQLSYMAQNHKGEVVGYVLAKLEDEEGEAHGHITSLAVRKSYRRLGIAKLLMNLTARALIECYGARSCTLHVRVSNRGALQLYRDVLGFKVQETEPRYYADGEDAYPMKRDLVDYARENGINPAFPDKFNSPDKRKARQDAIESEKPKPSYDAAAVAASFAVLNANQAGSSSGGGTKKKNRRKKH